MAEDQGGIVSNYGFREGAANFECQDYEADPERVAHIEAQMVAIRKSFEERYGVLPDFISSTGVPVVMPTDVIEEIA